MAKSKKTKYRFQGDTVFYLNPRTCGVYKNGGSRFKVDGNGRRTTEVDNELIEHVQAFKDGVLPPGAKEQPRASFSWDAPFVPRYHDPRWDEPFSALVTEKEITTVTIGQLLDSGILSKRVGHGSPGGDQRVGAVPYIKVSDLRNLRINVNPTNLIPLALAKKMWGSKNPGSGLEAWDLLTPIRASSNIGEFAILLPGEEQIVLTKEILVLRVQSCGAKFGWNPFYLMWALSLQAVRQQWQRITLMQTNREDIGDRFREIRLPVPKSKEWADDVSKAFRMHFQRTARSKSVFVGTLGSDNFQYIASAFSALPQEPEFEGAEGGQTDADAEEINESNAG